MASIDIFVQSLSFVSSIFNKGKRVRLNKNKLFFPFLFQVALSLFMFL